MKAKYLVIIGLLAATFAACSRDEESLFDKPAAIRAQEAIDNAFDVLTTAENGWEMAYFPNLEASAKGYNMVLKFNKNGNVSVTAKNSATTANKILTDTASTWAVKSDYGPILTFDTYNSTRPTLLTLPPRAKTLVPLDFSVPQEANSAAPSLRM